MAKIKKLTRIARINTGDMSNSIILKTLHNCRRGCWGSDYTKDTSRITYAEIFEHIQTESKYVFAHERLTYEGLTYEGKNYSDLSMTRDVVAMIYEVDEAWVKFKVYDLINRGNEHFKVCGVTEHSYQKHEVQPVKEQLVKNLSKLTEKAVTLFNTCYTVEMRFNIYKSGKSLYTDPSSIILKESELNGAELQQFKDKYEYCACTRKFGKFEDVKAFSEGLDAFYHGVDIGAFNNIEDAKTMLYLITVPF